MDKKHLGFGLLISFSLLTYFLMELKKVDHKQHSINKEWVGLLNGKKVLLRDLKKKHKSIRESFESYIDDQVLLYESKKLNIDVEEYLSFFDSIKNIPITKEEKNYFADWSEEKIRNSRPERAKKNLLSALRRQHKIEYCNPCAQ